MTPDSEQHPPTERPPVSGHARAAFALGVVSGIGGGVCWLAMWLHWTDWQLPLWLDVPLVLAAFAVPFAVLATVVAAISALVEIWRRRGQVHGTGLAIAALLLCIPYPTSFVAPIYWVQVDHKKAQVCVSHMYELTEAMARYLEDHDNTFPPASTWCDSLKPYVSDEAVFACPAAPELRCGYAYNAALSGLRNDHIVERTYVVAIFESDAGWNAAGGPELLPEKPRHTHGRLDHYAYSAGHLEARRRGDPDLPWEPTLKEQPVSP